MNRKVFTKSLNKVQTKIANCQSKIDELKKELSNIKKEFIETNAVIKIGDIYENTYNGIIIKMYCVDIVLDEYNNITYYFQSNRNQYPNIVYRFIEKERIEEGQPEDGIQYYSCKLKIDEYNDTATYYGNQEFVDFNYYDSNGQYILDDTPSVFEEITVEFGEYVN